MFLMKDQFTPAFSGAYKLLIVLVFYICCLKTYGNNLNCLYIKYFTVSLHCKYTKMLQCVVSTDACGVFTMLDYASQP